MADERGGGEDNINDDMGNQLQLLPGTVQLTGCVVALEALVVAAS